MCAFIDHGFLDTRQPIEDDSSSATSDIIHSSLTERKGYTDRNCPPRDGIQRSCHIWRQSDVDMDGCSVVQLLELQLHFQKSSPNTAKLFLGERTFPWQLRLTTFTLFSRQRLIRDENLYGELYSSASFLQGPCLLQLRITSTET